jgi:hypothetical protein
MKQLSWRRLSEICVSRGRLSIGSPTRGANSARRVNNPPQVSNLPYNVNLLRPGRPIENRPQAESLPYNVFTVSSTFDPFTVARVQPKNQP